MPSVSSVSGPRITLLLARQTNHALPRLGSGLNLYGAPAQAAGNSKLRMSVQGSHISIRA